MKYFKTMLIVTVLFLVGCDPGCYSEVPLTKEHSISVDSSVLGLWEDIPNEGEEWLVGNGPLLILKYSDTEYLIKSTHDEHELYHRGYPIKIGDISCVQLQVIGGENGPPPEDEEKLFLVVSYLLEDDELEVKLINTHLVDDDLKASEALRKAFVKHKDNKDLFTDPAKFKRVKGRNK